MIPFDQPDICKPESYLFYQSRQRRPVLDRGRGVYLWDTDGKRYLDGSSGAMVSNIGHSNTYVLTAMKAQMDKATFGYRLHFETEASEELAKKTASLMPEGLDRVFFVSGGSEAVESALNSRANGRWLRTGPTSGKLFPGFRPTTDRHSALWR